MIISSLRERIQSYEELSDHKLIKRLPVITIVNGRSFRKTTSLLHKPYHPEFMEVMCGLMIKLCCEVDGSVFAYAFNDEIVLVSRNDQHNDTTAWCENKIQKMVSCVSCISAIEFQKLVKAKAINILGDPVFTAKAFVVPNITEAINVLIAKQQQAFHLALSMACFYELIKRFDASTVKQTLSDKSPQEKSDLLLEQTGIEFNTYPQAFKRGAAVYRAPKVVKTMVGDEIRNKLMVDTELPIFTKDREFLETILNGGKDVVRL